MKIAMIGQKGIPAHSGGVEKHVEELGRRLTCMGHSVTVYCRKNYNDSWPETYKGMELKVIPCISKPCLEALSYTFLAVKDAVSKDYDIIHFHALGPSSLSWIPKMLGKKIVVTIHGLDWKRQKWGRTGRLYLKMGERIAALTADRCILVSQALYQYFTAKYPKADKYVVIPNGVTLAEPLPPEEIFKWGLKPRGYLLYLARLVPEKGCHYLIEAFKKVKTAKKLVIAGASSHTDAYAAQLHVQAKGDERIVFTGAVGGRLLNELYSHAYAYVLPSEIEGLPITLLEALSFGTYPVTSDIPENLEVTEKKYGGWFASRDIAELKKSLEHCLASPDEILAKGRSGREYVKTKYCWDLAASRLADEYKLLAEV